jgi:hypothetical protein
MANRSGIMFSLLLIFLSCSVSAQEDGYLLNMYHFNIQYVAGSEKAMRQNVEQSFAPLVDFYVEHPGWGADFEMQGQYIEFLASEYPSVLAKFKRLVNSGQAELVSFHYSDQFLLAFPAYDQERSLEISDRIFEDNNIKRSGVIFCQEAQFGEGLCDMGRRKGYEVAVMNYDLYRWFQDDDRFPFYTVRGMDVMEKRDATHPESGIRVKWLFLGDGELVVTGGISPYFAGLFKVRQGRLKSLEKKLEGFESEGYKIATVSQYHRALQDAGVEPVPLKSILDAPWRPEDDDGIYTWLGKYVFPWEEDYKLRTENWRTRGLLIHAETKGINFQDLWDAWKHQLNAEVTDTTGWSPFPVEIRYGHEESEAARREVKNVCPECEVPEFPFSGEILVEDDWPIPVSIRGSARDPEISVKEVAEKDMRWGYFKEDVSLWIVEASWRESRFSSGSSSLVFPLFEPVIAYSPAMLEGDVRRIHSSEIKAQSFHLALPNGLIGLGNDYYLIRYNLSGVLAAKPDLEKGEVCFEVKKARGREFKLMFLLLRGPEKGAIELANEINLIRP